MRGKSVIYLGRIVDKKHFRAFVYGFNGEKKLVESWNAFESAMKSGIWFATKEDVELVEKEKNEKPEKKSRTKPKTKVESFEEEEEDDEESEEVLLEKGDVFEVTDEC